MEEVKKQGMESLFVPYEIALKLKALGFDERVLTYYENGVPKLYHDVTGWDFNTSFTTCVSRPTFSQAFRWFREKHSLLHELISCVENSWLITIVDLNSKSVNGVYMKRINLDDIDENIPTTYEEAELACLDKLIEIVESKQRINRIIKDVQDGK